MIILCHNFSPQLTIDLNPASFKYLEVNARNNHCGRRLHCYNRDARYFVVSILLLYFEIHRSGIT